MVCPCAGTPFVGEIWRWVYAGMKLTAPLLVFSGILALGITGCRDNSPAGRAKALAHQLTAFDRNKRGQAEEKLVKMGAVAVPALIQMLATKDEGARKRASRDLARIGKPAVPALLKAMNDEDLVVQAAAIDAIRDIGPPARAAIPELLKRLPNSKGADIPGALAAMGPEVIPPVIKLMKEKPRGNDTYQQLVSTGVLLKLGASAAPAIPDLAEMLHSNNRLQANDAAWVLGSIGAKAMSVLLRNLKDKDCERGRVAALIGLRTIGRHGHLEEVTKLVLPSLRDPDPAVRGQAIDTLWEMHADPKTVSEPIRALLNDPDKGVRSEAQRVVNDMKGR